MTTITGLMAAQNAITIPGVVNLPTFPDEILPTDTIPAKVVLLPTFSQDVAFVAPGCDSSVGFQQVNKIIIFLDDISQGYDDTIRASALTIADASVLALNTAINAETLGANVSFTGSFSTGIVNKRTFRTIEFIITSLG